jgi:hypothetical protein
MRKMRQTPQKNSACGGLRGACGAHPKKFSSCGGLKKAPAGAATAFWILPLKVSL